ncbi:MAG: NAD(P)/FAD-dependent oxidoreductase, partial [Pseudomonadota bacterium]
VPLPNHDTDYLKFTAAFMMNQYNWSQDKALRGWLRGNRLDGFSGLVASIKPEETQKRAVMDRLRQHSMPAMAKLQQFLGELAETGA